MECSNIKSRIKKVKVTQSCLTVCHPMGYTVHGILQARILKWVAFPFSRGSSQPSDRTQVSCIEQTYRREWLSLTSHPWYVTKILAQSFMQWNTSIYNHSVVKILRSFILMPFYSSREKYKEKIECNCFLFLISFYKKL